MGQSGRMAVAQQGRAVMQLGSRNLMHAQCEFLVSTNLLFLLLSTNLASSPQSISNNKLLVLCVVGWVFSNSEHVGANGDQQMSNADVDDDGHWFKQVATFQSCLSAIIQHFCPRSCFVVKIAFQCLVISKICSSSSLLWALLGRVGNHCVLYRKSLSVLF